MNAQTFLGLQATHNPHRWYLPVEPRICAGGQFLFGGTGLAAAVTALEATCDRPLIWATAQYLSFARPPSIVDFDVTIPVAGRHTTQARAIAHVDDTEILTANAALGTRPLELKAQWAVPPQVPPPGECPPVPPWEGEPRESIRTSVELRVANGRYGDDLDGTPSDDGRSALWARIPDIEMSAATLAIIADWVPSGVSQALGQRARANSLDNTIRIIGIHAADWVLCDIRIMGIHGGFGHGIMHLWNEDGQLMATASQSVVVRPPQ
jgi:acyl-CoA thioesterase-2